MIAVLNFFIAWGIGLLAFLIALLAYIMYDANAAYAKSSPAWAATIIGVAAFALALFLGA